MSHQDKHDLQMSALMRFESLFIRPQPRLPLVPQHHSRQRDNLFLHPRNFLPFLRNMSDSDAQAVTTSSATTQQVTPGISQNFGMSPAYATSASTNCEINGNWSAYSSIVAAAAKQFEYQTQTDQSCPQRKWTKTNQEHSRPDGSMEFTFMTYNILSQNLLAEHPYLYSNCQSQDLDWVRRRSAITLHIREHEPDIVCLQEMEEDYWVSFFYPYFSCLGYAGTFKKRTSYYKNDGCAILYNQSKFSLVKSVPIEFCKGGHLDRDNVGIILVLKPNWPFYQGDVGKICVATTHLLFNPKRGDIKLGQLMLLLAELDKYAFQNDTTTNSEASQDFDEGALSTSSDRLQYCPSILCGDFNMEPFSPLYKFVVNGHIRYEGCVPKTISGQKEGLLSSYSSFSSIPRKLLPKHLNITENCRYATKHVKVKTKELQPDTGSSPPPAPGISQFINHSPSEVASNSRSPKHQNPERPKSSPSPDQGEDVRSPTGDSKSENDEPTSKMEPKSPGKKGRDAFNTGNAYHHFRFRSVYKHYQMVEENGKWIKLDEVSSYHTKACCTLDYIFYSSAKIPKPSKDSHSSVPKSSKHHKHHKSHRHRDKSDPVGPKKRARREKSSGSSRPTPKRHDKESRQEECRDKNGSHSQETHRKDIRENYASSADCKFVEIDDSGNQERLEAKNDDRYNPDVKTDSSSRYRHRSHHSHSHKSKDLQHRLQLVSRYELLNSKEIKNFGLLPNAQNPSDHLCLISKFILH